MEPSTKCVFFEYFMGYIGIYLDFGAIDFEEHKFQILTKEVANF